MLIKSTQSRKRGYVCDGILEDTTSKSGRRVDPEANWTVESIGNVQKLTKLRKWDTIRGLPDKSKNQIGIPIYENK